MNTKRLKQTFWYDGKKYLLITFPLGWQLRDKYDNYFSIHLKKENQYLCRYSLVAFTPDDYLVAIVEELGDYTNHRFAYYINRYFIKSGIIKITARNKIVFVEKYSADITYPYRKYLERHKTHPLSTVLDELETLYDSESKCIYVVRRNNLTILFWKMDDPSSFILESLLEIHNSLLGFHVVPNTLKILEGNKIGMIIESTGKSKNKEKYNLVYDLTLKTIAALEPRTQ
jgi:hypothetical protein